MDAAERSSPNLSPPRAEDLDALADRLRAVRRQLSRGKPLAGVLKRDRQLPETLRAAQRLDAAVQRLGESKPIGRISLRIEKSGWPWLVRVVEQRAGRLERMLGDADAIC